ncbi:hypothetical protein IA57_08400 [Mangrovimonas yunxiaonensis]|uniref:Uncharacterized protein n=2 Tax=Mangrovimonas yunxiaonensis TaxID=1197477 RepID=A0A084TIF7_9FLAO|nr:hypothetical protein IA57_08400 [Mangrovimonas yunxiaonensis]
MPAVFSQNSEIVGSNRSNNNVGGSMTFNPGQGIWVTNPNNNKNRTIDGSPYLYEDWNASRQSKMHVLDKTYLVNGLNYNVALDRFEVKIAQDSVFAINSNILRKVEITDKEFVKIVNEHGISRFYEFLGQADDNKFLIDYKITIVEGAVNPMTQQKLNNNRMVVEEEFYVLPENEKELKELKLKKKDVTKYFNADKKEKILNYVKSEKLKFNDLADLKKIMKFYNTI